MESIKKTLETFGFRPQQHDIWTIRFRPLLNIGLTFSLVGSVGV